jgi:multidrug efflux system membrane fusion protein
MRSTLAFLTISGGLMLAFAGCEPGAPNAKSSDTPAVPVSHPAERDVTENIDFTGRTDAVEAVDIRARVTGYLLKTNFKEGSEVKAGDVLFEIDPRPYQAQLDQAMAQVDLNQSSLKLARTTYERDRAIALAVPGGVSQQQLDQELAAVDEAVSRVKASQASTEVYKLNVGFCKVVSPISGQISRYYLTQGNLINQDQTLLTTIVTNDPMYVYFDLDEPTLLRIRRATNEGRIKRAQDGVEVFMGLQGEEGYPHKGTVNFVNNQVTSTTGSILVRGVFPNPRPEGGSRLLSPGMFARVRLPIGQPRKELLVIDRAIQSDQGLKFVYVLDKENKVQSRRISTGALEPDGLRVIEREPEASQTDVAGDPSGAVVARGPSGLKKDDWVVVGSLQQVRPRMVVTPEEIPMPTLGRNALLPQNSSGAAAKPKSGGKSKR